jgi:F0F1-type ATP synthase membrane subunit b/b'
MDINNIIPYSMNDFGAILFWVIIIILLIAAITIYWYYRKISKKAIKTQEELNTNLDTIDQMKKPEEESVQEPVEVKNNVEEMIEEEKNKL